MMNESCANRNAYLPTIVSDATQLPSALNVIVLEYLPRCNWTKGDEICTSFVGITDQWLCECHNPYTPKYSYGKCIHTYAISKSIKMLYFISTYRCGNMVIDGSNLCFQHTYVGDTRILVDEDGRYYIPSGRSLDDYGIPHRCIAQKNKICRKPTTYKYTFKHNSDIKEIN
jgi:hypothetical protein